MIFYFSGTGNSKHVAQSIARITGDKQIAITKDLIKINEIYELEVEERIGFVFPVYWYSLPTLVVEFLKNLTISGYQSHYVYGVATYGIAGGKCNEAIDRSVRRKKATVKREIWSENGRQLCGWISAYE